MPSPNADAAASVAASETPITTFSSDKEALVDLLLTIHRGKTQLPDFQRGWVWDDDHIRSLLASERAEGSPVGVPQPHRAVPWPGGQATAVERPGDTGDRVLMASEVAKGSAVRIPELHCGVG